MADIQYYERVFKKKSTTTVKARVAMLAAYALLLSVWLIIVVRVGLSASLLMLIPLSVLTVVLLTWKYTSVEYEYSFAAGVLTFSKIYSGSKRKCVFEADLRQLVSASPASDSALARVGVSPTDALPEADSDSACLLVFEENGKQSSILLDCDDMTVKILRFFKPSAVDNSLWLKR